MNENAVELDLVPESRMWLIWLAIVCLACATYCAIKPSEGDGFAYLIGLYLVPALIIWAIFRAVAMKKVKHKRSTMVFGFVFASMVVGGFISQAIMKSQIRTMSTSLKDAASLSSKNILVNTESKASGDIGKMDSFMKTAMNKFTESQNTYVASLGNAGAARLIGYSNVDKPGELGERLNIIENILTLANAHKAEVLGIVGSIRNDIATLDVSQESRDGLLRGFNNSMGDDKVVSANLDLGIMSFALYKMQHEMLARSPRHWALKDGRIMFNNNAERTAFNTIGLEMQDIQAKLSALDGQRAEGLKTDIQGMENLVK